MPTRSAVILLAAFTLAGCAHQPAAPSAPDVRRYTVLAAASPAGREVVTTRANERTIDYEYTDRGRGPRIRTVVALGPHGIPIAERTTGNDYYKSPVDERLTATGDSLHYSNGAEVGSGTAAAFYVGMYGPPEEVGLLARALLAAGGHLALLPAGEGQITAGQTVDLGSGTTVTRYEIAGLGFAPQSVWLDRDGEFFATVSASSSVIREGHERDAPRLLTLDDDADRLRSKELARRLTRRPVALAISNARLFDPATLAVTPGTTIVIRGNRIVAAGRDVAIPSDAEMLDAGGRTVIPGLWDMHVHLSGIDGMLDIASGVTTVRDLANDTDYLTALARRFADGTNIGPRVLLAGVLEGPGPFHGPTNVLVDNEDEVRAAIDHYLSLGYVQVKIYSSIRPALVPFIAAYAHSKGMRVSGHVPAFMNAEQAVRDGYDEIQHANMVLLNFLRDVQDTRTPLRFTAIAERGSSIDLQSPEVRAFFDLLREHKTVIDPTASVFENLFVDRPGVLAESITSVAGRLPPQVRRGYLTGGLAVDAKTDSRNRAAFAKVLELVRALHDGGIPIVAGTDGPAGFTLHRELELYVRAGIPAPEVLRIATLGAARVMHRDGDLGSVEAGKVADLVVIDGDPTTNISDIRKPLWVVKDGMLFDAKAVYAALGVQ